MMNEQEHKFGTCQWCGKHNVMLSSVTGSRNGRLVASWICNDCLRVAYRKTWGDYLFDRLYGNRKG